MSFLLPTKIIGEVRWTGRVTARAESLASIEIAPLELGFEGVAGEHHSGLTRRSCSRVKRQYEIGTEIRNTRQVSVVSEEELALIASGMGVEVLRPSWFGANICLRGIEDLTRLPPASRLIFDSGASLVVDTENTPCKVLAEHLETHYPGQGMSVPKHALGRRGIVAWVERPGPVTPGDTVRLHTPRMVPYAPLQADNARSNGAE